METITVKTWRFLNANDISVSDLKWLEKNVSRVEYTSQDPVEIHYHGSVQRLVGQSYLKVLTNNDKQEMMLHIKYSDQIVLESWCNVATSTMVI